MPGKRRKLWRKCRRGPDGESSRSSAGASTVTMPARFRPMDIGREFVLGLWRDADDVEHVRLYRLDRP